MINDPASQAVTQKYKNLQSKGKKPTAGADPYAGWKL
jgi:hypothetical protein